MLVSTVHGPELKMIVALKNTPDNKGLTSKELAKVAGFDDELPITNLLAKLHESNIITGHNDHWNITKLGTVLLDRIN